MIAFAIKHPGALLTQHSFPSRLSSCCHRNLSADFALAWASVPSVIRGGGLRGGGKNRGGKTAQEEMCVEGTFP